MVKKLITKVSRWSFALFLVEWCCYFGGLITSSTCMKLMLLTTARVLP